MRKDFTWFVPEILRDRGELPLLLGTDDPSTIEGIFDRPMSYAQDRQALYWQSCTAISKPELMVGQGRIAEARALLAPLYSRLTAGFSAPKVKQAEPLLARLQ